MEKGMTISMKGKALLALNGLSRFIRQNKGYFRDDIDRELLEYIADIKVLVLALKDTALDDKQEGEGHHTDRILTSH